MSVADVLERAAAQVDPMSAPHVELVMGPLMYEELMDELGAPASTSGVHYEGLPVRVSPHAPEGKVLILDANGIAPSPIKGGAVSVSVRNENTGAWKRLGATARETSEAFHEFAEAALAVSGRMLPPPEWQDRAVRAAQTAGLDLEWCQHVSGTAGRTDTWAHVSTKRGGFDVRPGPGESWTQALAAAGIEVKLS